MNCKCMRLVLALGVSLALLAAPAAYAVKVVPPPVCPIANQTGLCTMLVPLAPLLPATQPKFAYELPKPVFYNPDTLTNPLYDYYRIASSRATLSLVGNQFLQPAPLKPDPFNLVAGTQVPKAWLGLVDPLLVAPNNQLWTEVWGYNQLASGNAAAVLPGATYPSMSFRATRGKPVKVEWINQLPDQHLFCKQPLNSDVPCAIDRTIMGTLLRTPATGFPGGTDILTNFGGPMQPDNAMVVHLHGGEIPPDSDGFAELWFGNAASMANYGAAKYPTVAVAGSRFGATQNIDPFFDTSQIPLVQNGIQVGNLIRPTGTSMIYNYPMVQDSSTIWYHDHALGKTRVNVAAGPAGYFYVQDPAVDPLLFGNTPDGLNGATPYAFGDCSNGGILGGSCRDVPIVFQDRSFNADGSINFPNGLGQLAKGNLNPLTPGVNPAVHPQWVPEYFGDMAVVNGTIWPKVTVLQTNYRFRLLDGSNARCYTLSLAATRAGLVAPAPAIQVIASDQGFLPAPVTVPTLTMCPGERYEVVLDFSANLPGDLITVTNTAGAPFPAGPTPQAGGSPYLFLAQLVQFQVVAPVAPATIPAKWVYNAASWTTALNAGGINSTAARIAAATQAGTALTNRKFFMLNEVLDPISKAPLRVQIDGKAFEAAVTETPKRGTFETWQIANTTVDAHPMHLHLVQFKVISRQAFNVKNYLNAAAAAGALQVPLVPLAKVDPTPFLVGLARTADPAEAGFKDTAIAYPGEVLTLVAKWDGGWADLDPVTPANTPTGILAPQCQPPAGTPNEAVAAGNCRCVQQQLCDPAPLANFAAWPLGTALPPGNATCFCVDAVNNTTGLAPGDGICDGAAPQPIWATVPPLFSCGATLYKPFWQTVSSGPYVWHCHIVDHEDNEMMRPSLVIP